jgi:hypothetical protein
MAQQERTPSLTDAETRVFAKIVDDLSELDQASQKLVFLNLKDQFGDKEYGYKPWPMFVTRNR